MSNKVKAMWVSVNSTWKRSLTIFILCWYDLFRNIPVYSLYFFCSYIQGFHFKTCLSFVQNFCFTLGYSNTCQDNLQLEYDLFLPNLVFLLSSSHLISCNVTSSFYRTLLSFRTHKMLVTQQLIKCVYKYWSSIVACSRCYRSSEQLCD